jgi:hypothetical protein
MAHAVNAIFLTRLSIFSFYPAQNREIPADEIIASVWNKYKNAHRRETPAARATLIYSKSKTFAYFSRENMKNSMKTLGL